MTNVTRFITVATLPTASGNRSEPLLICLGYATVPLGGFSVDANGLWRPLMDTETIATLKPGFQEQTQQPTPDFLATFATPLSILHHDGGLLCWEECLQESVVVPTKKSFRRLSALGPNQC